MFGNAKNAFYSRPLISKIYYRRFLFGLTSLEQFLFQTANLSLNFDNKKGYGIVEKFSTGGKLLLRHLFN